MGRPQLAAPRQMVWARNLLSQQMISPHVRALAQAARSREPATAKEDVDVVMEAGEKQEPGVDVRGAWHLQGAGGGVRPHGVEGAHQDPAGAAREPRGPEHSFFACVLVVEWIGYSKCYHLEKRPHIVVSVVVSQVPK